MLEPQRIHVLVADDEPHIGRIIKMKLEQGPFAVTLAYDGREALAADGGSDPEIALVLLDVMMPYMTGLDVLAKLRARRSVARGAVHRAHRGGPGAASQAGHGARRQRVSDEAVQPEEALRARGGADRLADRGAGSSTER